MSDNTCYQNTVAIFSDPNETEAKWPFPQDGRPYYKALNNTQGGSLFDDAKSGVVNAMFTADKCTPITNFLRTSPSLAFMNNFDAIYTAISNEITPATPNPCNSCLTQQTTQSPCNKCPKEVQMFVEATKSALKSFTLQIATTNVQDLHTQLTRSNDPSNTHMLNQINLFHDFAMLYLDTIHKPPAYLSDEFKGVGNVSFNNTVQKYGSRTATDKLPQFIYQVSLKAVLDSLPADSVFKNCQDGCQDIPTGDQPECTGICGFKGTFSPPPTFYYMNNYNKILGALKTQISQLPSPIPPANTFTLPASLKTFDLTKTKIKTFYFDLSTTQVNTLKLPNDTLETLNIPESKLLPKSIDITLDFCDGDGNSLLLKNVHLPKNTITKYSYKAGNLSQPAKLALSAMSWLQKSCP